MRTQRIRALAAIAVMLMCLLGARAAFLGTVRAGDLSERGRQAQRAEVPLLAQRGSILAADGTALATDQLAVDVSASPRVVTDPRGVADQLAPILKRDPNVLANALSEGGGYAILARGVAPRAADRARALELPGIYFSDTYERFLPSGSETAQVVGLTGEVPTGLEQQHDAILTGTPGHRVEVRDLFGRPIQILSERKAQPGRDVRLTLDPAIQAQVKRTLAAVREKYHAKSASAIVMNPDDGAILAMASAPSFNPNDRRTINPEWERNRPVVDPFEPGSTFKIVAMTAALEDGKVTPQTPLVIPSSKITLYEGSGDAFTLEDAHEHGPQRLTATEVLEQSSNIGVYKISLKVGKERLHAWMKAFGFGAPTGIDFPGEAAGYVPPPEEWFGFGIANFPIGQGVSVNLTQLARGYAAIANGGRLVQPHLVAGAEDAASAERIMSARTADQVRRMLRKVVSERGTGTLADVPGYDVAGKTGTGEKIVEGVYSTTLYTSSFVGYAPADDPKLLIAVVVDEPGGGTYYGGEVAAPAFAEITEFSLKKLKIRP